MTLADTLRTTRLSRLATARPAALARRSDAIARLRLALRALSVQVAEEYLVAVRAARRRAGRRAIHQLRIVTRRVLALREVLQAIDPTPADERLESHLQRPFRRCGRLRDLQLMAQRLNTLAPQTAAGRHLRRVVKRRERRARERTERALANAHPRRVATMLNAAARRAGTRLLDRRARAVGLRAISRCVQQAEDDLLAARLRATGGEATAIHRARIALKQCRYLLELVAPLGLTPTPGEYDQLRRLQQALGALTDCSTMLRILARYADAHPAEAQRLGPLRREITTQQARLALRLT